MCAYYSPTDDISYTPLTADEEARLFEAYHKHNDLNARDKIIQCHLKLVAKLALRMTAKSGLADDDAISAANFGLIKALESKSFKPDKGRFATYVRKYVVGQVMKALGARPKGYLSATRESPHALDAILTGVLHETEYSHLGMQNHEGTVDPAIDSEEETHRLRHETVMRLFSKLPKSEQKTIREHYFEGLNFSDIARGRKGHPSREGIRKAHNRAIERLRKALEKIERTEK